MFSLRYLKCVFSIRFISIVLFLFLMACNEKEENKDLQNLESNSEIVFDKKKWNLKEDSDYPFRDRMLKDIVFNDTVRSLSKIQILSLLGAPNRKNENHYYYTITQKRIGLWPIHTKSMVIKLKNDSSIEWIKIHE